MAISAGAISQVPISSLPRPPSQAAQVATRQDFSALYAAAWQQDAPPQQRRLLPPDILAVPVNDPPFSSRPSLLQSYPFWAPPDPLPTLNAKLPQEGAVAVVYVPSSSAAWQAIIAAWQPIDPYFQIIRKLAPGIPGVSVDNPPAGRAQPLPAQVSDFYVVLPRQLSPAIPGQSVDLPPPQRIMPQAWPSDDPPIVLPRLLAPGIPGQSVDPPPPRTAPQFDQSLWQMPTQPVLPKNLSPGIPGQSVDDPPRLQRQPLPPLPDVPMPVQVTYLPQGAVAGQTPYAPTWLASVLSAWTLDYEPQFQRLLNPSIIAVRVDNPPTLLRWWPPYPEMPPLPQLPTYTVQGTPAVVNQPIPYLNAWLSGVLTQWIVDYQPQLPRLLNPSITAVRVDNPPTLLRWQPPFPEAAPLPQMPIYLVQGAATAVMQPYAPAWFVSIEAWQPVDPPQQIQKLLSPGIPGQSVDAPPSRQATASWQWPQDDQPIILPRPASPAIPGWSVDPPPPRRDQQINYTAWQPDWPMQPLRQYSAQFGQIIDNPPFTHMGRMAGAISIVLSWQPIDPMPAQRGPMAPSLTAVQVDNPPFGYTRPLLTVFWLPDPPMPYPSNPPMIPQGGTTPPPVGGDMFTVSGPDVRDLFGTSISVSYLWSPTQKRTV